MTAGRFCSARWLSWPFSKVMMMPGVCSSGTHSASCLLLYAHSLSSCSVAMSIKMSVLLYLPGLLVILFKRKGLARTFSYLLSMAAIQYLVAVPFIKEDPWAYLHSAFDLGRVFLYKWTVNWRMLDEDVFLSPEFATVLMVGHVSLLVGFGLFKWCAPDGGVWPVLKRGFKRPLLPASLAPVTPDCECAPFTVIPALTLRIGRCCDCAIHLQSDRHHVCQIATLPVLLLVRPADPPPRLEDKIRGDWTVSISFSSARHRPDDCQAPSHWRHRVRVECLSFYQPFVRHFAFGQRPVVERGVEWISCWRSIMQRVLPVLWRADCLCIIRRHCKQLGCRSPSASLTCLRNKMRDNLGRCLEVGRLLVQLISYAVSMLSHPLNVYG